MEKSLEECYNLIKHEVQLKRVTTRSGKVLEVFEKPSHNRDFMVKVTFPEFTCLCPKTSQPDFATIYLFYCPKDVCVELKALKYYLNSFRNEGHFHEELTNIIFTDLAYILGLEEEDLLVVSEFNVRGGTYPSVFVGNEIFWNKYTSNRVEGY